MATLAPPLVKKLALDWEKEYGSAVLSGVIGDLLHRLRGGYHISREDQPNTNFSVKRPQDKAGQGPDNMAAAIDMTMNAADMKKCTARLVAAYNDRSDPRRKYINAFNGYSGIGTARRYDVYASVVAFANDSHKWHVHLEIRRAYVGSAAAMQAILSILRGESKASYLASIAPKPPAVSAKPVASGAAVKAPAYPGRVLRRNDAQKAPDAALKVWQARVVAAGWTSLGKPDGMFGAKTENIVKAIQRQHKQSADGVIGPKTWPLPWA